MMKSTELRLAMRLRDFIESHDGCRCHGFDLETGRVFVSGETIYPDGTLHRDRETIRATVSAARDWLGY